MSVDAVKKQLEACGLSHSYREFKTSSATVELAANAIGGVCPFALNKGVRVFLDASLRLFDPCYPAAGASNNAVQIFLADLERVTGAMWIDVCKTMSPQP